MPLSDRSTTKEEDLPLMVLLGALSGGSLSSSTSKLSLHRSLFFYSPRIFLSPDLSQLSPPDYFLSALSPSPISQSLSALSRERAERDRERK